MTIKVAINGFGRIGRMVLRALIESGRTDIEVVAINDLSDVKTSAHLLQYDSVHGRLHAQVQATESRLSINGKAISLSQHRDPAECPWGDLGVDIVFECTGIFTSGELAGKHLTAGAKKVLISAPGKEGVDLTVVYGVNHTDIKPEHKIISNASCTTNCLAPVAKVLHESFGIKHGFMTTIHAYTGDQRIVDTAHKDLHRARAAAANMIPTSTGAAKAVGKVLPALDGKLDGVAMRVPTPNVSVVDLKLVTEREVTVQSVNEAMIKASDGDLNGVLGVYDVPLVSSDFNHDPRSSIFALNETKVMDNSLVRVMSWYDNEWGFSNRMLDTAAVMGAMV